MFYAGIDIGSTTTKTVIMDQKSQIVAKSIIPTGINMKKTSEESLALALDSTKISREEIKKITATGYGRNIAAYKDVVIPEILAIAQGSSYYSKGAKTILDIGGQDMKVVKVGEKGNIVKFVMNDICAAGTGRFLENIARSLNIKLEEMINKAYAAEEAVEITSSCIVLVEAEVITYFSKGENPGYVLAGLHKTMIKKAMNLVKMVGNVAPLFFTGGVTKNKCIKKMLEKEFEEIRIPENPQLISAIGAALFSIKENYTNGIK